MTSPSLLAESRFPLRRSQTGVRQPLGTGHSHSRTQLGALVLSHNPYGISQARDEQCFPEGSFPCGIYYFSNTASFNTKLLKALRNGTVLRRVRDASSHDIFLSRAEGSADGGKKRKTNKTSVGTGRYCKFSHFAS